MDINTIIRSAIRLCELFAEKSEDTALAEYELLAYEQMCNMIEKYSKLQAIMMDKAILESERELLVERENHERWLSQNDNEVGGNETPAA